MRKPDFFIVGAPKCGTTSLYTWLNAHPQIYMADVKEPYYFCPDIVAPRYADEADYLNLFDSAGSALRVGEASTWYLYSEEAASRIHSFNPDARIIIMLREPVAMMASLHAYFLYIGQEDISDFGEALEAEELRMRGERLPRGVSEPKALQYRKIAAFSEQVARYIECFGRERVHLVLLEEMKRDAAAAYRDILRFLDVDETFAPDFSVENSAREVRNPRLRDMVKQPPAWISALVRSLLPQSGRDRVVRWLHALNARSSGRKEIDGELRARLSAEMADEVIRLERITGVSVRKYWNRQTDHSMQVSG